MRGRARILISDGVLQQLDVKIEKPLVGRVAWDWLEVKELLDTWKSVLKLPDGYDVVGSFFDVAHYFWVVIIESDKLPLLPEFTEIPIVQPQYRRLSDGTTELIEESLCLQ